MQRVVRANGVDLCTETFGRPQDPAILLISGASGSMDWWRPAFCERLAAGGRFVVRYDHRDTGQSAHSQAGAPDYTGADLVADVVGVLDALELGRAHLVGVSMGGGLAQAVALDYPERVASLTLIATSSGGAGPDNPDLPPPSEAIRERFANPAPAPDWSNRDAVIDYLVEDSRAFAGALPFDEEEVRVVAAIVVDRTLDIEASMTNHWIVPSDGEPLRPRLGQVSAPTLVLHGTHDPLFPLGHGEALAREIPDASLLLLEGMGHEVPPVPVWDQVVEAILNVSERR